MNTQITPMSRRIFRNIHVLDILRYRLPLGGIVSILHRITGALLFLFLGVGLYLLDLSLSSEESFQQVALFLRNPFVRLFSLFIFWSFMHHLFAGIRFLFLDCHIGLSRSSARNSSVLVLLMSLTLTLFFGAICL